MVRAALLAGLFACLWGGHASAPAEARTQAPADAVATQPEPRLVVLVFDRHEGRSAAAWFGARRPGDEFAIDGKRIAVAMTTTSSFRAPSELLGYATGKDGPRERLAGWIRQRNEAADVVAAWADRGGVSSFEGKGCRTCRVAVRGDVLVLGVDVSTETVIEAADRMAAVGGDPVERLLAFNVQGPHRWPGAPRPGQVELVAQHDTDLVESIRAEGMRRAPRILMREHLSTLAHEVAPHFLGAARTQCERHPHSDACLESARRAHRAASRALALFSRDENLRDLSSEAQRLLELGISTH